MLIEFSVANFRSIRETQTLNMVANADDALPENVIETDIPGMKGVRLLRSAIIYGANASGKSNIYKAAAFMQYFAMNSARYQKGDRIAGVVPFVFDPDLASSPSEFEILFVHEGVRYQYGFSVDAEKVHEEWLTAYPKGKPQMWFHRTLKTEGESSQYAWKTSSFLKGHKKSLSERTSENRLFLSFAAQENHEQLSRVHRWFHHSYRALDFSTSPTEATGSATVSVIHQEENTAGMVAQMLRDADTGIESLEVEEREIRDPKDIRVMLPPGLVLRDGEKGTTGNSLAVNAETLEGSKWLKVVFRHVTRDIAPDVVIPLEDESVGTQKFFGLAVPWLATLLQGYTIFLDEMASSMHPSLVQNLLRMLAGSKSNAQAILTSHQTSLLTDELFRRDQIWFTEKDDSGATDLYPLTDYKPRKDEALEKGYLAGRYGAIPFLGEFTF